jgi:hypothetical protein
MVLSYEIIHRTFQIFGLGLFIALIMEAVRTSKTSVYSNETITPRYIPESCHLQVGICERL